MINHRTARIQYRASQMVLVVKNLPANAGDIRDTDSIPGLERSPGGALPGESHGQGSLVDSVRRGRTKSDMTEVT